MDSASKWESLCRGARRLNVGTDNVDTVRLKVRAALYSQPFACQSNARPCYITHLNHAQRVCIIVFEAFCIIFVAVRTSALRPGGLVLVSNEVVGSLGSVFWDTFESLVV